MYEAGGDRLSCGGEGIPLQHCAKLNSGELRYMTTKQSYNDYVNDQTFMDDYAAYQTKYATTIRESDRVILQLVAGLCQRATKPLALIDIGCSTGNLLLHLKNAGLPLSLSGGEMALSVLEQCESNLELSGIEFHVVNALDINRRQAFDIAIVNAVFYLFSPEEFTQSLASIYDCLKPGGSCVVFDFFHPYEQDLSITELSKTHEAGITLHMRPFSQVEALSKQIGFTTVTFQPFEIPIDLPRPAALNDIRSHTVKAESGVRLLFRGALYQPWCHLTLTKGE